MTTTLSTKIMPPILEYSYPSFPYNSTTYSFIIKMSVINDINDFSFLQIRTIDAASNNEGFNIKNAEITAKTDHSNYFINLYEKSSAIGDKTFGYYEKTNTNSLDSQITITLNPYIKTSATTDDGTWSIFNIYSGTTPIPVNFKLQCRLGDGTEVSEWSNAAILRVNSGITLGLSPETLIDNKPDESAAVTVTESSIIWTGSYQTDLVTNSDEVVDQYSFLLEEVISSPSGDSYELKETSGNIAVGDYELPHYEYRFKVPFENSKTYRLTFTIETNYGYVGSISRIVNVSIPYQRLYDIFDVSSNDEEAYNSIVVNAQQIFLKTSVLDDSYNNVNEIQDIKSSQISAYFLQDQAMDIFEEPGAEVTWTHLRTVPLGSTAKYGRLISDSKTFLTSDTESLSIILAATHINSFIDEDEALQEPNLLFRINSKNNNIISQDALDIKVGAMKQSSSGMAAETYDIITKNGDYIITQDGYRIGAAYGDFLLITEEEYGLKNYYRIPTNFNNSNSEVFLVITKKIETSELSYDIAIGPARWIENNFKES